jgi:hypothetical protein
MLQVQGRSDLFLGLEIIKKCIALGPLLIGAFVGIMPMLYSNLVITIISFFLNSYYSGKILNYSSWMQLKDVAPSYGVAFTVALSVFFLKYLPISNWVVLPIQMFTGMAVFLLVCSFTGLSEYNEVKSILKPILKRITHK